MTFFNLAYFSRVLNVLTSEVEEHRDRSEHTSVADLLLQYITLFYCTVTVIVLYWWVSLLYKHDVPISQVQ